MEMNVDFLQHDDRRAGQRSCFGDVCEEEGGGQGRGIRTGHAVAKAQIRIFPTLFFSHVPPATCNIHNYILPPMPDKVVQSPYPLIDADPHFSRVVRYMRPSDYAVWAGATAAFPSALYFWGNIPPTIRAYQRTY